MNLGKNHAGFSLTVVVGTSCTPNATMYRRKNTRYRNLINIVNNHLVRGGYRRHELKLRMQPAPGLLAVDRSRLVGGGSPNARAELRMRCQPLPRFGFCVHCLTLKMSAQPFPSARFLRMFIHCKTRGCTRLSLTRIKQGISLVSRFMYVHRVSGVPEFTV